MAIFVKRNRKMIILSFLYILAEVLLALFFFGFGLKYLSHFNTLGENTQLKVWNEQLQIYERKTGDNSMLILLFGVLTIAACILFAIILCPSLSAGGRSGPASAGPDGRFPWCASVRPGRKRWNGCPGCRSSQPGAPAHPQCCRRPSWPFCHCR